ncbi:MAG: lipid-A-disaccharide synthase N-terminal domain-containing protein [Candidatus Aenigmatarchaeota archaeon]
MIEIGIIGASLLLVAWIFETIKSVRKHKALVDLKFAVIYVSGTIFLATYSYLRSDFVFLILNFCLMTLVFFEIAYTLYMRRKKVK